MNVLRMASVLVACIIALAAQGANATPSYYVNHRADAYGGTGQNESVGPQGSPIEYDFPFQPTYGTTNYGEVHASAKPGALGIYALAYNNGQYAPARQEVVTSQTFELMINSPRSNPVDIVINLELSGDIDPSLYVTSTVQVFASISFVGSSSGSYAEFLFDANPPSPNRSGMLASFSADGTKQTISTDLWQNVPVNVPLSANIQMNTIQAYGLDSPTISFGNTLSLATSGDVFTISGPNAAEVTVNSTDANIVNNRYGVPEPGTALLLRIGALGVAALRRRHGTR